MAVNTTSVDIKAEYERRGFSMNGKPTRVWTGDESGYDEYHGSCPWCGGTNRFMFRVPTGRYSCAIRSSGCGRYGNDVIDFLEEYEGMTFREACEELGVESDGLYVATLQTVARKAINVLPPGRKWQERAATVVLRAERYLFSAQGKRALAYLYKRGFTDDLIKKYHIGYIPLTNEKKWYKDPFDMWGMKAEDYPDKEGVVLPPGILIPWYQGETIWRLQIRRLDGWKEGDAKYLPVLGSQEGLYNVDAIVPGQTLVIVESALDALAGQYGIIGSAQQEQTAFVATGSTTGARSPRWFDLICAAANILVAYDDDANGAGDKGSRYWLEKLPHAIRWLPWSHDVNDMLTDGVDIPLWVTTGLTVAEKILSHEVDTVLEESSSTEQEQEQEQEQEDLCSKCGRTISQDQGLDGYYSADGKYTCSAHVVRPGARDQVIPDDDREDRTPVRSVEEYWERTRRKLAGIDFSCPAPIIKPRVYPVPFPCRQLVTSPDGKLTVKIIGTWHPVECRLMNDSDSL